MRPAALLSAVATAVAVAGVLPLTAAGGAAADAPGGSVNASDNDRTSVVQGAFAGPLTARTSADATLERYAGPWLGSAYRHGRGTDR